METKQLVDKFLLGEITDEQFDIESSKLTDEQKVEKNKLLVEGEKALRDKIVGLRKTEKATIEKNDLDLTTKMQKENLEAAKTKFFSENGIEKEEDQKSFEEGFKTNSVNVDNIINDMKSHYVSKNPDHYLNLEKEKKNREKEAEDFTAKNAGAGGSNGGGQDNAKIPKEVKLFMEESAKVGRVITPEQATRALNVRNRRGHIS